MANENERLKLWLGFWRVVIVSGVVGAIGIIAPPWINAQIQNRELEIAKTQKQAELAMAQNEKEAEIRAQRLEIEQDYVKTFLDRATEENVERRYRFTRYVSALTLDPELKAGWNMLLEDAKRERAETKERLEELRGQTSDEAKAEIVRLQQELETTRNKRDFVSVTSVSLASIETKAPCPNNTSALLSAIEYKPFSTGPFEREIYKKHSALALDKLLEKIWAKANLNFNVTYDPPRVFHIARWCMNENDEPVGDIVIFGSGGDVIGRLPSDEVVFPSVNFEHVPGFVLE